MTTRSNVQIALEKARAVYQREGAPTLFQQICQIYRLTIRQFAEIFDISKAHAEDIIKHRTYPTLKLSIDIARYFEVTVEDLFGWRIDDHGKRRPLVVVDPKTNKAYRIGPSLEADQTMSLVNVRIRIQEEKKDDS